MVMLHSCKYGADAIEIHAYGGYLIDQFLTLCGTSAPMNTEAALKTGFESCMSYGMPYGKIAARTSP